MSDYGAASQMLAIYRCECNSVYRNWLGWCVCVIFVITFKKQSLCFNSGRDKLATVPAGGGAAAPAAGGGAAAPAAAVTAAPEKG